MCRSRTEMAKAVAVLGGTEGVTGTVYFTQEGDGKLFLEFYTNLLLKCRCQSFILFLDCVH